jgi:DNA polymerase-4
MPAGRSGHLRRTVPGVRWVLHLDMDAFYASVEQLTRPTLCDRPVLVGGLGPRAVVAAASYQAREYGARSAMSMAQARRLCPSAVVLPPRFGLYHTVSERVFDVLRRRCPVVEQVSLDEAFLEPPALAGASPQQVRDACAALRAEVRAAVGLACSVGAGSGKQLAKIASELGKPDGHHVVPHGTESATLDPLPVRWLWGIGPVAEARLRRIGVTTIGELAALDARDAAELLGDAVGSSLHRLAHGIDDRPVATRTDVRSVSAESTFDLDVSDLATIEAAVCTMATSAHRRLVDGDHSARTVTVKVRGADFAVVSRSESLPAATTDLPTLLGMARRLVRAALPPTAVRLIGVAYTGLNGQPQEALFGLDGEPSRPAAPAAEPAGTGDRPATVGPASSDGSRPANGPTATGGGHPHLELPRDGSSSVDDDPAVDGPAAPAAPGEPRSPGVPAWRPGDDVFHDGHGHGWVQGCGVGRVTVRFETRHAGPGRAVTFAAGDPALLPADPLASLDA